MKTIILYIDFESLIAFAFIGIAAGIIIAVNELVIKPHNRNTKN